MRQFWVRADASRTAGLGHVMRTLAVAEAARALGVPATYVSVAHEPFPPSRRGFGVRTVEPGDRSWCEDVAPDDVVLFDGYGFEPDDHAAARRCGARVGAVDDLGQGFFDVDVVVNPNPVDPADLRYETADDTAILIGPRHAMVRQEFVARRRARAGGRDCLVVTLGGSDAAGATGAVVDVVVRTSTFRRTVLVVGSAAPAVTVAGGVEVVRDPPDVAAVFDGADAVVSAAGSTTWELCCMGLPVALVQVADNQAVVVGGVARAGAALVVGGVADVPTVLPAVLADLADPVVQRETSRRALDLVDGAGAERVVAALLGGTVTTPGG